MPAAFLLNQGLRLAPEEAVILEKQIIRTLLRKRMCYPECVAEAISLHVTDPECWKQIASATGMPRIFIPLELRGS